MIWTILLLVIVVWLGAGIWYVLQMLNHGRTNFPAWVERVLISPIMFVLIITGLIRKLFGR